MQILIATDGIGIDETSGDGGQRGSQSLLGTYVGVLGVRNMSHSSSSVL